MILRMLRRLLDYSKLLISRRRRVKNSNRRKTARQCKTYCQRNQLNEFHPNLIVTCMRRREENHRALNNTLSMK